jgi:hypothetical protein
MEPYFCAPQPAEAFAKRGYDQADHMFGLA